MAFINTTTPRRISTSSIVIVCWLVFTSCVAAPRQSEQAVEINNSLEGLWVSCPERTEWGPMFSQLRIWREDTFEMRTLGRDANQEIWSGVPVLEGQLDRENRRLVPDDEFDIEEDERWEYEIVKQDELVVRHVYEEGVEETRLRRLE